MSTKYLKAINIQVLTLANQSKTPDERFRPVLRLDMDDGREFYMSGIPSETAYNISYELTLNENKDSRMQIYELIGQLAVIDRVEIDLMVPGTTVYSASLYLTLEGFSNTLKYDLIPSSAILIAVSNDSPVFVAEQLVSESELQR